MQSVQGVETAVSLDAQQVQAKNGSLPVVWGIDPNAIERVWSFDWISGSDAVLTQLGTDGAIVEEQTAASLGVKQGGTLKVTTVEGKQATLKVLGIYRDPMMLNGITVSTSGYAALFPTPQTFMVVAKAQPGADIAATQEAIETALASTPTAEVKTSEEYKKSTVDLVNQLLMLIYGLLALSVIISLFGIVNTLVLAVYERTREIGLVRAIGMSRGQVRATVRYESVITSIIGAIMGIVVGIVFAWVVTTRFAGQGITFSVPGAPAGRVPRARGRGRRDRRHPAGAAGGQDRHPGGHPLRVTGARRRSGARPQRERRRPVLGYHLRAPAVRPWEVPHPAPRRPALARAPGAGGRRPPRGGRRGGPRPLRGRAPPRPVRPQRS